MNKRTAFVVCLRLNANSIQVLDDTIDLSHADNPVRVKFNKLKGHERPWICDMTQCTYREPELRAIANCLDILNTPDTEPHAEFAPLYNHTVPCPRCKTTHRVLDDEGEVRCACGCEFEYEVDFNIRE